ncbi:MAG: P-loop NTPase [Haloarculaceae archaeon]
MLAIVGGKGGCGKTTTALGVARALAADGRRPVVVDADCSMPNLHAMADTDLRPGLCTLADGSPVDVALHPSRKYPELDVLPAGTATGPPDESTLARVARASGPVVLDCPAGATEAVTAPLRVADSALVVSTAERASLVDAAKTARMASALDTTLAGSVLTRTRDGIPDTAELTALRAECQVLASVPETEDVLSSRVGRAAYGRLASRLAERNI